MAISSTPSSSTTEDFTRFSTRRIGTTRDRVRSVAWNLDGRRLATGGVDRTLRIYLPDKDARSSTECRGHSGEVSCVRWNPTHPERLATCSASSQDKALHFWDIRQGSKPTSTIETHGDNITMVWSPDGKTIVLGNRSDEVTWIDVEEQRIVRKETKKGETNEAIFSHNGSLLFTGIEGVVHINAFPSNTPIHTVTVAGWPTTVLDLDPRGRYLAAGSNDTTLTLLDTEEWTCVATSGVHEYVYLSTFPRNAGSAADPVRMCRISPDGNYLASSASDSAGIIISEIPSLRKLHSISTAVSCDSLAWHPTKNVLAYGGGETAIWGAGV
ncbi:hypothetical protein JCM10207_004279 [Rhodosporidiobolus poonsookiae]